MMKRILSLVLVLGLLLCMVPVAVTAQREQVDQTPKAGTHTDAGHSDDCGLTSGWQEWTDATKLPTQGQYVLKTNIAMTEETTLTGDLTLCLNGYVVTAKPWARILGTDGATTLTITDCTAYTDESGVYQAGILTGAKYTGSSGGAAIFVRRNGVLKLYDGRITGNRLENDQTATGGGAVMIQDASGGAYGTMYMYGGEISRNSYYKTDDKTGNSGGAIAVGTSGKLVIEDGLILNNFGGNGGAIWVRDKGELTINGGTFRGNEGHSGGVVDLVNGAKMTITGGTFTENTGNTGGVLHIRANVVGISGAAFEKNTATFTGSAIYIYSSANLTIGDGTVITGNIGNNTNTSDGWGAAVVGGSSSAKVTLTGKVVIADNVIGGATIGDLNLRQAASDTLYIQDLDEGSRVVFSTPKTKNAQAKDVLALSGSQTAPWNNSWLTYKDENATLKRIGFDGSEFSFLEGQGHFHGGVEYMPLESTDQLIAGGSYYLADETFTLTKEAMLNDGVTLNLCLNGHKLTANGHRAMSTYGGPLQSVINLYDCTAYHDDQGVYHAGAIDGIKNSSTGVGGGAIFIRKNGTLNMYGGILSNNYSAAGGGAMQLTGTANIYGGEFYRNQAPGKDGGAILIVRGGVLNMTGGAFRENSANNGGAFLTNGSVNLSNVTITGNTGKYAAAFGVQDNSAHVTLKNVTITGNNITGEAWGGINIQNNVNVKLEGKVVIENNLTGSGKQQNLYLCKGVPGVDGMGLTDGSRVGITLRTDRISAGQMYFTTSMAEESYFSSDDDTYMVGNDGSRLILKPAFTHEHCQCGKTDCTDTSHKKITYRGWSSGSALPPSGNYCLLSDVKLRGEAYVSADLNLCLHGHKVVNETGRVFSTPGTQVTVNVADCQGTGSVTGKNLSVATGGGAVFVRAGGTVNWYGGSITGSQSAAGGGAVLVTGAFNLYGGEISGNRAVNADGTTWKDGGAFFLNAGSVTNIYGGKITNNAAAKGSAIYVYRATLNIHGGQITGNTAQNQGAIVMNADVKTLSVTGAPKILGNTANGAASNIVLSSTQKLTLKNVDPAAQVGVTAPVFCPISEKCDDCSASFASDNTGFQVVHRDGALYLEAAGDHQHCLCIGTVSQGCDHSAVKLAAWTDPNALPASGNYYLAVDVTVPDQKRLTGGRLNLCLNGHTIRVAENGNRVFYIRNDTVLNITDCAQQTGKITGAKASAIMFDGGCDGAVLNLYRGEFSDNYTTSVGGAIIVQGKGTFNMYGGLITENISESKLVLDGAGKPVLDENGSQTITTPFGGGGVGGYGADAVFNMYGGEISGNTAIAVTYLNEKGVEATSAGSGGGVYFRGTVNMYGGKICNNTGEQGGGLMLVSTSGVLNMYGGEISGNMANRAGGGLITQSGSTFNLYEGLITGNEAGPVGGAGAYISTNTTMNMEGGTICENYAPNGGAGLYIYRSKVNLKDGLITGNKTGKNGNGAGIFVAGEDALLTMTGGTISKNEAYHAGGVLVQARGEFVFKGGKIAENRANQAGGGIYVSINSKFTMTGGSIVSNWAKYNGGGLSLYRCQASVTGGSISYNTGYIGGVHVIGTKATFTGTSFVGNKAVDKGHGGAMAVASTSYKQNGAVIDQYATCTLNGCHFGDNSAENGGAIIVMSKGTQFYMYGGTVTGNQSKNGGGGIYLSSNTSATLSGVRVTNNSAKEGGGIFTFRCSSKMEDMHIEGNTATGYGGGISLRGLYQGSDTLDIKNSKIIGNSSSGGGGLIVQHYMTMNMDNCLVENNDSTGSAGGVYNLYQSTSHFTNTQFRDNHSGMSGGAVLNTMANWATFDNCIIENNVADKHAGGIYNRCRLEVYNTTIQNNRAALNGGAISTDGASNELSGNGHGVYMENVKVLANSCGEQGGGIYLHRGCPDRSMKNVIYMGNTSGKEGSAIYSASDLNMENVEATGNRSENGGFAVYLADSEFDGHGYFTGHKQMSGNMIIRDNEGGDLYLGQLTALAITGLGLGEKSHLEITLHSGLLTQRVFGTYDYEGGECVYTVTYGDRSMTDPEAVSEPEQEAQTDTSCDWLLYAGVGIFALAAILLILLGKKKKAKKA